MPASPTRLFVTLTRAGVKAIRSKVRGLGLADEAVAWPARAEACERCPMRVVKCGVSYCGQPLLRQVIRDPAVDGCGCPTRAKAKDPAEHCPVTPGYAAATTGRTACDCKWCALLAPTVALPVAA